MENFKIKGKFTITEYDLNGNKLSETTHENVITNAMRLAVVNSLIANFTNELNAIGYLAVGDGDSNAPAATDTELDNQLGTLKEYVPDSLNNNADPYIASATFFFDSGDVEYYGDWEELGLYAKDGETLLTRSVIDPLKTFDATKNITVTYGIEVTEAT